jgi:predicted TIM-barrel fold metal-dependent hydrolase
MTVDRIISADDHMDFHVLPPNLFVDRVPKHLVGRVPRVVDTAEGPFWEAEGRRLGPSGRKTKGLIVHEDHGFRPGIPERRLEDMDRDGIYTHVIYGPPGGIPLEDRELRAACLRAYNDWANEFNAVDRSRLVVLALLPGHDPKAAAEELRRVAPLGHKGALFGNIFESTAPIFEEPWEPFWATANEVGIPIHFHLGGGCSSLGPRPGSWRQPAFVAVVPMQLDEALCGMVFSGLLERYPNVRLVLGESGLGWVPYVVMRMDHEHHKYYDLIGDVRLKEPPSTYYRRQVYVTFEEDDLGLDLLPHIGADRVMWASDYPHGDSTWPHSRKAIDESWLGKLDDTDRRRILWDNGAELYKIGG